MEYYLYCWLGVAQLGTKCKIEERQDKKVPQLAEALSPEDSFRMPSPEWYALITAVCFIGFCVGHMWIRRFLKGRRMAVVRKTDDVEEGIPHRRPSRPPRATDGCVAFEEERM